MKKNFTVFDLLNYNLPNTVSLDLRCLAGRNGLETPIIEGIVNRPGLALCGFFDNFGENRLQVFGQGETAYLNTLTTEEATARLTAFFSHKISCCIFTSALRPPAIFFDLSAKLQIPVLQTPLSSSDFQSRLFYVLSNIFATTDSVHGNLLEVYGLGLLIIGESGVGKSEAALELVERGHKLIADDLVVVKKISGNSLQGSATRNKGTRHQMEIRGLGLIDVAKLFGKRAVRLSKQIDLVIDLENWVSGKNYVCIGDKPTTHSILGVEVPKVQVFMKPGRNVPIIMEAAVLAERDRLDQRLTDFDDVGPGISPY